MKERKLDRLGKNWLRITLSGSAIRFFNATSCRYGEIDIIACNSEYLVFCEVKTRKGSAPLHPSLSVTKAKGKRIRELAGLYLMENEDETRQPRFDVISVIMNQNHEGTIEHLENAF